MCISHTDLWYTHKQTTLRQIPCMMSNQIFFLPIYDDMTTRNHLIKTTFMIVTTNIYIGNTFTLVDYKTLLSEKYLGLTETPLQSHLNTKSHAKLWQLIHKP